MIILHHTRAGATHAALIHLNYLNSVVTYQQPAVGQPCAPCLPLTLAVLEAMNGVTEDARCLYPNVTFTTRHGFYQATTLTRKCIGGELSARYQLTVTMRRHLHGVDHAQAKRVADARALRR